MKNIVICCDGTGNQFESNITNVVDTYDLASKSDEQVVFYDPGVGTGGWQYDEGTGKFQAVSDLASGGGLQKNIEDAYRFLMQVYEKGDRIYLFGFSRGAFTARSLAGMLRKCGLLQSAAGNLVEFATKIYNTERNGKIASDFKATFSRKCPVHFIGVWDTVGSLTLNAGKRFHNTTLNNEVSFGYHAMSIDEIRKDFPVSLWNESKVKANQVVEQVWFAGVHSNVGGWYDDRGLSNLALQWMMGKAKDCGMEIDEADLATRKGNAHGKLEDSHSGFWFFRGKNVRKIEPGSRIHTSVIQRKAKASNKYDPDNLPKRFEEVK
jgi:uncharacterized protein (DUF2235 family)